MIIKTATYKRIYNQQNIPEQTCKDLNELKNILNYLICPVNEKAGRKAVHEGYQLISKILNDLGIED